MCELERSTHILRHNSDQVFGGGILLAVKLRSADCGMSPQAGPCHQVTQLLHGWSSGDKTALPKLVDLVYSELRKSAGRCLSGERPGHTLPPTALVNEAYLRLVDIRLMGWKDRAHFFAMAARILRRILVDHARAHAYAKRGGGTRPLDLQEALSIPTEVDPNVLRLDEALQQLGQFDPRKACIVEMRYFGGLTFNQIASVLRISPQTVARDWSLAKAWLKQEITREESNGARTLGSH